MRATGTLGVVLRGIAAARARWRAKPTDSICRRGVQTPRLGSKANQLGAAYDRPGKRKSGTSVFSTGVPAKRRRMGGSETPSFTAENSDCQVHEETVLQRNGLVEAGESLTTDDARWDLHQDIYGAKNRSRRVKSCKKCTDRNSARTTCTSHEQIASSKKKWPPAARKGHALQ